MSSSQANEACSETYDQAICRNDKGAQALCKIIKKCFCDGKKKKLKRRCFLMTTLGIVSLSPQYEEAFTRQLAKAASSYRLVVVRFTPFDTRPNIYEWPRDCRRTFSDARLDL